MEKQDALMGHLVLTRAEGEAIVIGSGLVTIEVVEIKRNGEVRLRIAAPKEMRILRAELLKY